MVLIDKLPFQQKKRVGVTTNDVIKIVTSPLIKFFEPEDDIQQKVDECEHKQPYIVVVDRCFFAVDSLLRAFEVLYKTY
jgi:hypothetical protein